MYKTSPPLDKAATKEEFLEKVEQLYDSVQNIIDAHETWLEDSLDWTKKNEVGHLSRMSRSWLDESLEEAQKAMKLFSRYKRFKDRG
tara:strand:- start:781 stop:1041 length:261 start_codon:yes stop_codon:yes gene_type:complete